MATSDLPMREKMARSLHHVNGHSGDGTPYDKPYDSLKEKEKAAYLACVDAVLNALVEPTDAMLAAGEIVGVPDGHGSYRRYDGVGARDAYRRQRFIQMICAAKEGS